LYGFYVRDSQEFEAWQVIEQERLHRLVVQSLQRMINHTLNAADYSTGTEHARRLLNLEPWREEGHRYLMQLLALQGQREAALVQYETCCRVLAAELGVEPSAETTALKEQIRTGELARGEVSFPAAAPPATPPPCPYRGLFAFKEPDAPLFFGRELFVSRLVETVPTQPLTAVIGPSGSGKSSVVFAGLLARLRQQEPGWPIVTLRPSSQPFQALAEALLPLLEPDLSQAAWIAESISLAAGLRIGEPALSAVTRQILDQSPQTERLLLVIDQFEELYTLCPEQTTRQCFLDMLLDATASAPSPARSVIARTKGLG